MTIADEVRAATTQKGDRCTVGKALEALDPTTRAEFETIFGSDAQGSAIARVLSNHAGIKIVGQTLQRHRTGGCNCGHQ